MRRALPLAALALAAAPTGAHAAERVVDMPAKYFVPPNITTLAGDTVTWTNSDHFTHSVQFLDGGLPSEPLLMEPGQSATFTFASAGTFRYQCHFHPQNMQGTVTVTP